MNSEIRLHKPAFIRARRAIIVIAVIAAWAVAVVGIMRDREPGAATTAEPHIEQKAPAKPYYNFMVETPV
jgi:hypothetical protein